MIFFDMHNIPFDFFDTHYTRFFFSYRKEKAGVCYAHRLPIPQVKEIGRRVSFLKMSALCSNRARSFYNAAIHYSYDYDSCTR